MKKKRKRKAILLLAYIADVSCLTNRSFYISLSLNSSTLTKLMIYSGAEGNSSLHVKSTIFSSLKNIHPVFQQTVESVTGHSKLFPLNSLSTISIFLSMVVIDLRI